MIFQTIVLFLSRDLTGVLPLAGQMFEKMTSQDMFWSLLGRFGRPKAPKREDKRDQRGTIKETKMTTIA